MMSLVSVIIPVYNGAEYIEKGIQSIIEQTYKHIEIIAVNDGSKDASEMVIQKIAQKHQSIEIKYVYQENAGIAMARNKGLDEAAGVYVMFMDQDDWLEKNCVQTLVECIEEEKSDLVIGGFRLVDAQGKIKEVWELDQKEEWSKFRITAPWGRIFDKEIIDKYHLRFMNTKISEDLYFNLLFFSHTARIKVIPYAGYNWLYNMKSESRTKWNVMSEERNPLVMLDELHYKMKKPNSLNETLLTYFFTKYIIWYLLYSARGNSKDMVKNMCRQCTQWLDEHYPKWSKGGVGWKNPGKEVFLTHAVVVGCVWLYRWKLLQFVLRIYSKIW